MNRVYILIFMIVIILYEVYFIWKIKYEDIINNSYKNDLIEEQVNLQNNIDEMKIHYDKIQTNAWIVKMNEKYPWVNSLKNKWETIYTFLNNGNPINSWSINVAKSIVSNSTSNNVNTLWMKNWQKWIYYVFNIDVREK